MKCPNCGANYKKDSLKCDYCGTELIIPELLIPKEIEPEEPIEEEQEPIAEVEGYHEPIDKLYIIYSLLIAILAFFSFVSKPMMLAMIPITGIFQVIIAWILLQYKFRKVSQLFLIFSLVHVFIIFYIKILHWSNSLISL